MLKIAFLRPFYMCDGVLSHLHASKTRPDYCFTRWFTNLKRFPFCNFKKDESKYGIGNFQKSNRISFFPPPPLIVVQDIDKKNTAVWEHKPRCTNFLRDTTFERLALRPRTGRVQRPSPWQGSKGRSHRSS